MNISTMAFRNLARNKRRSALSILTIVLACIVGLFMLTLIEGVRVDMKENIISYATGSIQIRNARFNEYEYLNPIHQFVSDEAAIRRKLSTIDGVTKVVARITAAGKIYIDTNPDDDVQGIEFQAQAMGLNLADEQEILHPSSLLLDGRLPKEGKREVVLGYSLAGKIGLKTGDSFAFMAATADRGVNAMSFEIVGLVKFKMGVLNSSSFIVPFDTLQGLMRMEGGAQELLVMTDEPEEVAVQKTAIDALFASDSSLSYLDSKLWKDQGEMYAMMGVASLIYNFLVIFMLAMGATVIINTTMMVIYERYREIGILGAMGMKPNELVSLFFLEALYAGIISAVIGIILGSGLVLLLTKTGINFGSSYDAMDLGISTILYPALRWYHLVLMAVYTVGISALVTLIPCRKAAGIEIVEAIRAT